MNGLTLAYIGDAYFELKIRDYLITSKKLTKVNDLHKQAIKYTSAEAQDKIINYLINNNLLLEDEITLYKRGRNSSGVGRKNISNRAYFNSTGFEALIGGLYTENIKRCDEIISLAINYIEKGDFNGKSS